MGAMKRRGQPLEPDTIAYLRAQLRLQRGAEKSPAATYETIARRYAVHRAVIWRIMHRGYEPKDPQTRARLGLSAAAPAIPMEDGGLAHQPIVIATERACVDCGTWFVPNVPHRKRCHGCSPPKGKDPQRVGGPAPKEEDGLPIR